MTPSKNFQEISNKALQALVVLYQGVILLAFIAIPFLAFNWIKTPFIGAFVERTLIFDGVGNQNGGETWELYNKHVHLYDQLVAIDGQPLHNKAEMQEALAARQPGDIANITYRTPEGEEHTVAIRLSKFPSEDLTTYFYIPYIVGLLYFAISLWVFGLRRNESAGRAFALLASSFAVATASIFDAYTTQRFTYLWTLAIALGGGAAFDLALVFPQESRIAAKRPYLRWTGYIVSLILTALAWKDIQNFQNPTAYIADWQRIYLFTGSMMVAFIGILIYQYYTTTSPIAHKQISAILLGFFLGFAPLGGFFLISAIHPVNFTPYLVIPTFLFPLATGYSILRYRLLKIDYILTRSLIIFFLTLAIAGGYVLIITGLSLIFGRTISPASPMAIGIFATLLAFLLNPVQSRLQALIGRLAFRGAQTYQERIRTFGHKLTNALDLPEIFSILREEITSNLFPKILHIYIYNPNSDQYEAAPLKEGDRPTSDLRFSSSSPLVTKISSERSSLYLDLYHLPETLKSEETRLRLLGAYLFVPMWSADKLIGWLALGLRQSGEPYRDSELTFLENLSDQAALAIERARVVLDMQQQVQRMNTLTRISQGVNITLSFDDILELIFTQTTQIIPATDFHITLENKEGKYFYYAFCLEENERLPQRENTPLPPGQGLAPWVARRGRSVLTQDYTQRCQELNVVPAIQGVYAWMGVPLNAAAETIGTLSISNRNPLVTYTQSQLDLLQAIADQTAGAIVKARLLEESRRRARQLSTLNELTRQLTSTLEIDPLLQNILENAVNILESEAGTLFLVDEKSGDMVFKVTVGPVADNLIGKTLPPGSGIVGRVAQTHSAIIENDVQKSAKWFGNTDKQTGFITRAVLAAPLLVKERVIGVIEIINKRNGLPFAEEDRTLLMAFAGQAAVAIENARLYTLTDQELNARVEELSIMQRIDRELNASLEIERAMRITLDWAMRQSHTDAGLVGIVEEEGIRIMAHQGYGSQLSEYENDWLPIELPSMIAAIETGQPQHVTLDPEIQGGILPGTRTQVVVPLRREDKVIGITFLESLEETQIDLGFLTRLSDHAAIAISNAQLYAELEEANRAKSDFVSFVAHELKNPMTSIKGYTELLAAGAVGPINESQANFLNTIHSNVERMSTLVSDLNDNSKIEAGRLRLDFKAISIAEVVEDATRSTKRQTEEKNQTVKVEIPEALPEVWADRTRVGQVLVNLVSNANKYTQEGGEIIIGAEETENRWDPEGAKRVVHVWVKDNGIGISEEDQRKIFQKFFRSEDQKAREAPGTGLGLNITKSLVEMQGGKIWFESKFREGTTFHFTVPVAEK